MQIRDIRQTSWFWVDKQVLEKGLNVYELAVYCLLCSMANKNEQCFPSVRTIAQKLSVSERQVFRCLESLKEKDLLSIESGNHEKSNIYTLKSVGTDYQSVGTDYQSGGCTTTVRGVLTDSHTNKLNITSIINNKGDTPPKHSTQPVRTHKFSRPEVAEVRAYCLDRKNGIDAQKFVDYYEARGWKYGVGKPMADWKAAVRTWEQKNGTQSVPRKLPNKL